MTEAFLKLSSEERAFRIDFDTVLWNSENRIVSFVRLRKNGGKENYDVPIENIDFVTRADAVDVDLENGDKL